jgi:hypothetical protein
MVSAIDENHVASRRPAKIRAEPRRSASYVIKLGIALHGRI